MSIISISFPRVYWLKAPRERRGVTYFVVQRKRGWPISPRWFLAGAALGVGGLLPSCRTRFERKDMGAPQCRQIDWSPEMRRLFPARSLMLEQRSILLGKEVVDVRRGHEVLDARDRTETVNWLHVSVFPPAPGLVSHDPFTETNSGPGSSDQWHGWHCFGRVGSEDSRAQAAALALAAVVVLSWCRAGRRRASAARAISRLRTLPEDWIGPSTLRHQRPLAQDPLSAVLDGRPVQKSRGF